MAQKINVNRNVQDPFYRYKMPRLLAKVEGKGNGIKTVIANMPEIAKALSRPPTYPTKYFGCELGAQTQFDLKNDRYIVNGEHDATKLQDILDGFIRKFVLCPDCENPETVLTVKRTGIHAKCKACGYSYQVDPKLKLSAYIMKNPPPSEDENNAKNESSGTPPSEETAEDASALDGGGGGDVVGAVNGVGRGGSGSLDEGDNNDDDDDWAPAVEAEKLTGEMGKMVVDKDLEKSGEDRLNMLYEYLKKAHKDGSIQDGKKMLNEAERLELKSKAPILLVNVLFTTEILAEIKKYRNLLLRFCMNDDKAQRVLLGGIEQKVESEKEALLAKSAHIIKALYDNDICEEEVLLAWGKKPSGKYVKKEFAKEMIKIAQPVLTWLAEAEEEGSESDDEGEDGADGGLAVAFDDRSRSVGTVVEVDEKNKKGEEGKKSGGEAAKKAEAGKKDGGEDEFDIDAI